MNYSDFFVLKRGYAPQYIVFIGINDYSKSEEEFYGLIKRREIALTEAKGKIPGDMASGPWVTQFYSERFVNLLNQNKIKTFRAYPVNFRSKYGNKVKYYYLEFPKKVTDLPDMGKVKYSEPDEHGERFIHGQKGFYFDISEWDGSDIFGIKTTSFVIATKRLKELIEKAKLKNVVLTSVEEFSWGVWE